MTFSLVSGSSPAGIFSFEWTAEDDPIKRSRFTAEQIIVTLKENEEGGVRDQRAWDI